MSIGDSLYRRLLYVMSEDGMTQSEVHRQTGVPLSTLSYYVNKQRDLPTVYKDVLRNMYQREAYSALRDAGTSVSQAKRFSWYLPETVNAVVIDYGIRIKELTLGQMGTYHKDLDVLSDEYMNKFKEIQDSITMALSKHKAPYETIQEIYGTGEI